MPLLSKSEISSLYPSSVAEQPSLCQTRSETRTLFFFMTRLKYTLHLWIHMHAFRRVRCLFLIKTYKYFHNLCVPTWGDFSKTARLSLVGYQSNVSYFPFLYENIYCCYSFKSPQLDGAIVLRVPTTYEPRHEKTNILHMRKQRRRSAPLFLLHG